MLERPSTNYVLYTKQKLTISAFVREVLGSPVVVGVLVGDPKVAIFVDIFVFMLLLKYPNSWKSSMVVKFRISCLISVKLLLNILLNYV